MKKTSLLRRFDLRLSALVLATALAPLTANAQLNYATPYFITTIGGAGTSGSQDGTLTAARFNFPNGIAVEANGTTYVADTNNHTIRKITFFGVVTTIAGAATSPGFVNGSGGAARFNLPRGLAVDGAGNVYVADTSNSAIRKITPAGVVTTLAGGTAGSADGVGAAARFISPNSVAVDKNFNVFVADTGNQSIRKIAPDGTVTTLAGPLANIFGNVDATGAAARFSSPRGVAVDGNGNVYVADRDNNSIRKITPAGTVTTLAGFSNGITAAIDGTGSAARFNQPYALTVDASGNVYVADSANKLIRKVSPAGVVTTLAGTALAVGGSDGIGNAATFRDPQGIASDARGNLYIADTNGHMVRMSVFAPDITPQPISQVVSPGVNATFTSGATSNAPITAFQWQKDGVAIAGATTATIVPSPNTPTAATSAITVTNIQTANLGNYTLVATNMAGSSTSNNGVLSFTPPPTFASQPVGQNVNPGTNVTFTATATSTLAITYQWQRDSVAIPGATNASLTVSSVQVANLGNYTLVAINAVGPTTSNVAVLGFIPSTAGRLINLSILTTIPTSGDTFTMGYVIGGAGTTGTKPLVIRAAGPSLGALGVGGTLNDPKLELFAGSTKTGENDNWGGTAAISAAMAAVGAFPYTGPTSLDSAVAANLAPGDNSVKVSAAGTGTGTVIAEIYDATPAAIFVASTPRLVNVSVLKQLGTGLTVGFVIGGQESKTVLIRAVGPTLGAAPFNIPGVVADPQLTLFNAASAKIGENDNWGGTAALTAAFNQVGAFALSGPASRDAALLATLQPGNYTVEVKGTGTTTGLAIVEVYDVP